MTGPFRARAPAFLVFILVIAAGCSSDPPRIAAPAIAVRQAVTQAFAEYDTNRDGLLDAAELRRCPPLRVGLKQLDTNGDGKLSEQELIDWLDAVVATRIGLLGVTVAVNMDGAPLQGATVTFVPEQFLGPALKSASGVSDDQGNVLLTVEGLPGTGVQLGLFRVLVSKKNEAGEELLPARYNSDTVLGQNVGPDPIGRGSFWFIFELKSQ